MNSVVNVNPVSGWRQHVDIIDVLQILEPITGPLLMQILEKSSEITPIFTALFSYGTETRFFIFSPLFFSLVLLTSH
jgi:hypothetical protein